MLKNQFVKLTPNLKPQQVAINAEYAQSDDTVFGSDDYSKSITVYMDSRISRKKVQSLGVLFHSEYNKQGDPIKRSLSFSKTIFIGGKIWHAVTPVSCYQAF